MNKKLGFEKFNGPNIQEFINWLRENDKEVLSDYQATLASSYLAYKRLVFLGGRGAGRTTVVNLINEYWTDKKYPSNHELSYE